jgi:hypothetical protein
MMIAGPLTALILSENPVAVNAGCGLYLKNFISNISFSQGIPATFSFGIMRGVYGCGIIAARIRRLTMLKR